MREILLEHIKQYPEMEIADLVKLIYQSELGAGHFAPSRKEAAELVRQERLSAITDGSLQEIVPIGGGMARCDISCDLKDETLAYLFCETAVRTGSIKSLHARLKLAGDMIESGELPFELSAYREYLAAYTGQGFPPVSHSDTYKARYRAHYRLILSDFIPLLPVFKAIDKLSRPVVVVIDGMCASGKTTLAAMLEKCYGSRVVHMDDFFLPPALATEARLSLPGANVHYERFNNEVSPHLAATDAFSYEGYDCQTGSAYKVSLPKGDMTVIEGSYALSPDLAIVPDLSIYLEIEPGLQRNRLLAREGEQWLPDFEEKWIPLEKLYADSLDIKAKADIVVTVK